jgi:hypothetical protein
VVEGSRQEVPTVNNKAFQKALESDRLQIRLLELELSKLVWFDMPTEEL